MFAPRSDPESLPLLTEPLQPDPDVNYRIGSGSGWTRRGDDVLRVESDDARGALIQHAICRYYVGGVLRKRLAREYDYSDRQMNSFLIGRAGGTYSRPILAMLRDLGIPLRGQVRPARLVAVLRAHQQVIHEYDDLLSHRFGEDRAERYQRLRLATRLLSFADELS